MQLYLSKLIPRLKEFSANLDSKEIFIEIPWVIVDDNLNQQKYIFKRNGDLVMSLNGQVTIGKWEYLSGAKSLLIDRIQDKILLNQNFIDPAVMILKKDGFKDENLILANEILLPNLDVSQYLKKLYYQKNNISTVQLNTGDVFELKNYEGFVSNNVVTIEGERVSDGLYEIARTEKKLEIKDGILVSILEMKHYETNKGKITIQQRQYYSASNGDFVFQNNSKAPDGKYGLGFMKHIVVENGRIKK